MLLPIKKLASVGARSGRGEGRGKGTEERCTVRVCWGWNVLKLG